MSVPPKPPDYPIIMFWNEEDGGFIADIPAIRFCSAFGRTREEALAELAVARSLWWESVLAGKERLRPPDL